jgi:anti-sigma factor RsiW
VGPELTCRELVADYHEGALSAGERERFEDHMAACEGCSVYVEQIRTTIELTGHARALEERR